MTCMERNKKPFWYAQLTGTTPILDKNGYETGEYAPVYSEPILAYGVFSGASAEPGASRGNVEAKDYGLMAQYRQRLLMENENAKLLETSVLWVENDPQLEEPYDYVVRQRSVKDNTTMYSIGKVTTVS